MRPDQDTYTAWGIEFPKLEQTSVTSARRFGGKARDDLTEKLARVFLGVAKHVCRQRRYAALNEDDLYSEIMSPMLEYFLHGLGPIWSVLEKDDERSTRLRGYLRACIFHEYKTHYKKTRKQVSLNRAENEPAKEIVPDIIECYALDTIIIRYAHRLPEDERVCLVMHCIDKMPVKRISSVYGIARRTVYRRIHSAIARLAKWMEEDGIDLGFQ